MSIKTLIPTFLAVVTFMLLVACQREGKSVKSEPEGEWQMTLGIIKPNAVNDNHIGEILAKIEKSGLEIDGLKMIKLSSERAQEFYVAHKDRPFFDELVDFVSSGPVVAVAIGGPNAVARFRELVGATDPSKAAAGTIRKEFAKSIAENAIHGSDSPEAADSEIAFFFNQEELFRGQSAGR